MMNRRSLLLTPLALGLSTERPSAAGLPAAGLPAARGAWRGVSEVRFGGDAAASGALGRRLGVAVRAAGLAGPGLLEALDRGHVEFALLDGAAWTAARGRMGDRLVAGVAQAGLTPVARRALPPGLADALLRALG